METDFSMGRNTRWFDAAITILAAIGLIAIFAVGIIGAKRLVQKRLNSQTASGAGVPAPAPDQAAIAAEPESAADVQVSVLPSAAPVPSVLPAPVPEPANTPAIPPPASLPLPNPIPDFAVTMVDAGIITAGGDFRHATSVSRGEEPAIVFDIANIGTAVSERWQFTAVLPTFGGQFTSQSQLPLAPGDRVRFTLGFRDLARQGENAAVITIDPTNSLKDRNRTNDSAMARFFRNY